MVDRLPAGVLAERIFPLLSAEDLCACEAVRRDWHKVLQDAEVGAAAWRAACIEKWRGKANMPFSYKGARETPFHKIKLSPAAVSRLSVKELRELLTLRGVDSRSFIEKSEFLREFVRSTPVEVMGCSVEFENKWKASYAYALLDAKRANITKDELIAAEWTFFMKRQSSFRAQFKFLPNGGVRSSMPGGLQPDSRWVMRNFNPVSVQVDRYPPLCVSRREDDWGFRLENEYVVFYSTIYGVDEAAIFAREFPST
ncbi:Hypothetical Protein FCC1311_053672 [Hondaea fermentalgiana]|uniref:F-box domain-containing protein n=1 Tax=Hondaea fermentalgiana TaxID=2315210 RepID=A0A2R5GMQ4_9STRA|nr:Hypothetical Protein FCC1311_053672 [Hondaea fermentalgiana]|eukprot:GBG29144.1 Hypothetical Protein FCC1311_053672 [Hondaea fermentalgiana]